MQTLWACCRDTRCCTTHWVGLINPTFYYYYNLGGIHTCCFTTIRCWFCDTHTNIVFLSFPLTFYFRTKGTVLLYKQTSYSISPSETQVGVPTTKTQVTVTSTLGPVVEAVAHYFPIIRSSGMLPSYNSNPYTYWFIL